MKKKILCTMMSMVMAASLFAGCGTGTGTETSASDNSKTEETGTEAAEQPTSDNPYAAYAGTTISVAAIETGYGSQMWQEVTDAFTEETGIQVELTTDKKLEDVIGPSMQGGEYPDVIHLATGREAALTEQFIKGNMITDITDVLSMKVPGEDKLVSEKIAGGFTDTSLTNPYGDGKTYLAPMFYSPCGLFYNAGLLEEKGWDVPTTWDEMWELGDKAKEEGRRVIAVGTTSCRVLESVADEKTGKVRKIEDDTEIFIYPGYKFKCIDGLITNFHLPQSTLLMLVSALADKEFILQAYNEAVKEKYRFFSFGDAMLII